MPNNTPDGKEIRFLRADALPPAYLELIALLEPAVGTGIAKDYQEFFGMVSRSEFFMFNPIVQGRYLFSCCVVL